MAERCAARKSDIHFLLPLIILLNVKATSLFINTIMSNKKNYLMDVGTKMQYSV